ncbi:MAG: exodeoxyribonuclease VII large subunit [Gammaproteobacteria bacterium]|nr:exodeoxyribonuclease VII large subunit [Gammaproteobacteria bacterium]
MANADIYTVSRLNSEVRLTLELQFRQLWLVGEVSNFVAASSGHWYFSLKDQAAQVKVAMFKQNNRASVMPRNGQQVMIRARISVYEPRGEYQLLADFIEAAGDGLLRQQYEQLKAQLHAEGLFEPGRKKPLPSEPQCIGVITSPTGAAIRDILTVLSRRAPALQVIIYPSLVQGNQAAADLSAALQVAIRRRECDVLIIGRGGGSIEDLWCFNDETLARQIANCPIPIVSAVGHEVDFSISDFVADLRAATPSAAAELVSPDQQQQWQQIAKLQQRLQQAMRVLLGQHAQQWLFAQKRLQQQHPARRLEQQQQRLDELELRLQRAVRQHIERHRQRWQFWQKSLALCSPALRVSQQSLQHQQLQRRLEQAMAQRLQQAKQQWHQHSVMLQQISPLATLERGYAITLHQGKVVKDAMSLQAGDVVTTKVANGEFQSTVMPRD